MDKRRARSALEGSIKLPPRFWDNLQALPQCQQLRIVDHGDQQSLEPGASVKTDKETQSPLLKIFKDIMHREQTDRQYATEMSKRKEEKRRLINERPIRVIQAKPSKSSEITKSFQVKQSLPNIAKENEQREIKTNMQTMEEERHSRHLHEKKSSHSRLSEATRTTDRHRHLDFNKSYITSTEKKGSDGRSGHSWKPACQTVAMQEERRPSQVKTDPVSVAPMSLKKKMFWKKKERSEQDANASNKEYAHHEDVRRRSHHSKGKLRSISSKIQGKMSMIRHRSDHNAPLLDEDCCEIICETDDAPDEEYARQPTTQKSADMRENITLWQEGNPRWTNFVTELKKYRSCERVGVTLSLILLTVLIVGGVMYYYKVSCAPKPPFKNQQFEYDASTDFRRVKKSNEFGNGDGFRSRSNWDDSNIKTVDGIAGLSDYLGVRDLRELQAMTNAENTNSAKLQDFLKRLIETDKQIKKIRNKIREINVAKEDRYLKSERYKRSIRWHNGPRLFYKKQKKIKQSEDVDNDDEDNVSPAEEQAADSQTKQEDTTESATEITEHTTEATVKTNQPSTLKSKSTKKYKTKEKQAKKNKQKDRLNVRKQDKKKRIQRDIQGQNTQTSKAPTMIDDDDKETAVAIIIPKKIIYDNTDNEKRKYVKCTHVAKEHKSHEEHLKHPYYKNTERLDQFLDMLLNTYNASGMFDPHVNEMFKHDKTKCKHPSVVVGPVKFIQDLKKEDNKNGLLHYTRKEPFKVNNDLTTTLPLISHTLKPMNTTTMALKLGTVVSKTVSPKYNLFMSILTINPVRKLAVTEPVSDFVADRKIHGRRIMQAEEETEDTVLSYEDLQEVLSDDKMSHDESEIQMKRMKREQENELFIEKHTKEGMHLHDMKPNPTRPKLYNSNWKGAMPLYPDEVNKLLRRPFYKDVYKNRLPIRNNDVPEENDEDESILNDIDYIEDYSIISPGVAAKRAQAYSDYGVLSKSNGVLASNKNNPNRQDVTTTKIDEKLRFGENPNLSLKVRRLNFDTKSKQRKSRRIGRSLKFFEESDIELLSSPDAGTFVDTHKLIKPRNVTNTSIQIKNIRKHKTAKKNKSDKNFIRKLVGSSDLKKIRFSAISTHKSHFAAIKYGKTHSNDFEMAETSTLYNAEEISGSTDPLNKVMNYTVLKNMFKNIKFITKEDKSEQEEDFLNYLKLPSISSEDKDFLRKKSKLTDLTEINDFAENATETIRSINENVNITIEIENNTVPKIEKTLADIGATNSVSDKTLQTKVTKLKTIDATTNAVNTITTDLIEEELNAKVDENYIEQMDSVTYKLTTKADASLSYKNKVSSKEALLSVDYIEGMDSRKNPLTTNVVSLDYIEGMHANKNISSTARRFFNRYYVEETHPFKHFTKISKTNEIKPTTEQNSRNYGHLYDYVSTVKSMAVSYSNVSGQFSIRDVDMHYNTRGNEEIYKSNNQLSDSEKDLFSYLSNWLCAIVGVVSNVSVSTAQPMLEKENNEIMKRQYRTRSLKSIDARYANISRNAKNVTASSKSNLNEDKTRSSIEENPTTVAEAGKIITFQQEHKNKDQKTRRELNKNKTLVKRDADASSNFVYWNDIYDEDYGVDSNPYEKPTSENEKVRNKAFMRKPKEWIGKKFRKLSNSLHVNPYQKMLMVREKAKQRKDAEDFLKLNESRFRRNISRVPKALERNDKPVIDFNVLNSKMKEICAQAVNEVQQMRQLQVFSAREKEPSNPTSSLMQQLAQLMSDLVDLQVKQKTCRKLPPDLQEFLLWLTSSDSKPHPSTMLVNTDEEFADADFDIDSVDFTNDYGIAGLHDQELMTGYQKSKQMNKENLKPLCVNILHEVEDLINEYDDLNENEKQRLTGVHDYLINQLHFLRDQVDINDLTSAYNVMRYKRDATADHNKPHETTTQNKRNKRKFIKNFSKHTKTTANTVDDLQSNSDNRLNINNNKVNKERDTVTIGDDHKHKKKAKIADNGEVDEREKRNLRDVYYRAMSESNKFSTSTTTNKGL